MTDHGGDPDSAAAEPSPTPTPRLQIESGTRGVFWQIVFPTLMVLAALGVPVAAWYGRNALLDSRGGRVEATVVDPDAPGYEAVVEPTPTMLVTSLGADDSLEGVTFLSQTGPTAGGVIFIPVNTVVEVDGLGLTGEDDATVPAASEVDPPATTAGDTTAGDTTAPADTTVAPDAATTTAAPAAADALTGAWSLRDLYATAGPTGLTKGTEKLLGIGIGGRAVEVGGELVEQDDTEAVVSVTAGRWQGLTAPVAPLSVENTDLVTVTDESGAVVLQFPSGPIDLPAAGVGPYLGARNDGESEINRLDRQEAFWRAWLTTISASDDPEIVPGETDVGLGGFVRTLADTNVSLFDLPVDALSVPGGSDDFFVPDQEAVADLMVSIVPFPVGSDAAPRTRVRVLSGTGDELATRQAARDLVHAGAEIEIMGNAATFDHVANDIVYYSESDVEQAEFYAEVLGGANVGRTDEPGEVVQLTIVIGADFGGDGATSTTAVPDTGGVDG